MFEGGAIGARICRVGIVAMATMGLTFLEAGRALKGFNDESSFAEAAITVESLTGKLDIGAALVARWEALWLANGRLGMALGTDLDIAAVIHLLETPFGGTPFGVGGGWAVTHFAIYAGLEKALVLSLAGMAGRAVLLIGGNIAHAVEIAELGADGIGRVDHLPVVDPFAFELVVLQGEDVEITVGSFGGVGLLPF